VPDWQFESGDYAGVRTGEWAYPALADVTGDGALGDRPEPIAMFLPIGQIAAAVKEAGD